MSNFIASIIVFGILALATYYIISQKKKGIKCGSCSNSCGCSQKHISSPLDKTTLSNSPCNCNEEKKTIK